MTGEPAAVEDVWVPWPRVSRGELASVRDVDDDGSSSSVL